jgi:hypothetical protein
MQPENLPFGVIRVNSEDEAAVVARPKEGSASIIRRPLGTSRPAGGTRPGTP